MIARIKDSLMGFMFKYPSKKIILLVCLLLLSLYGELLYSNGTLYSTIMGHDNIIFIDGIYRVQQGMVPHLDFVSGLGLLNFYGGYWFTHLTSSLIESFLAYNVLIVALTLMLVAYISWSRLTVLPSLILFVYCAAIVGTPNNIGQPGSDVTFAMFYNRFGWALFSLGFLFLLRPNKKISNILEGFIIASILLFLLYTKITYFIALVGLLGLALALYPSYFYSKAGYALLVMASVVASVEIWKPGLHFAYYNDLDYLRHASGNVDFNFFKAARKNSFYIISVVAFIYLVKDIYKANVSYCFKRHCTIVTYFVLASLFVFENNYQKYGLPSLVILVLAFFNIFKEHLVKKYGSQNIFLDLTKYEKTALLLSLLLLVTLSIPEAVERQGALERFYRHGGKDVGDFYDFTTPLSDFGLLYKEGNAEVLQFFESHGGMITVEDYSKLDILPIQQEISQTEYIYMIDSGYKLFHKVFEKNEKGPIVNFDFANPFSFLLNTLPAAGEYAWYHYDRNISEDSYLSAGKILKNANYISIPRYPTVRKTTKLLNKIYGAYVSKHFSIVAENNFWIIWKRHSAE